MIGNAGVRLPVEAIVGATTWSGFHVDLVGLGVRMSSQPEDVPPLVRGAIPDRRARGSIHPFVLRDGEDAGLPSPGRHRVLAEGVVELTPVLRERRPVRSRRAHSPSQAIHRVLLVAPTASSSVADEAGPSVAMLTEKSTG